MVMQCPVGDDIRRKLFDKLYIIDPLFEQRCITLSADVFLWLIRVGKPIEGVEEKLKLDICRCARRHSNTLYKRVLKSREGIGAAAKIKTDHPVKQPNALTRLR